MGEKTEEATPRKLSQARSKGQIPKSQDLTGAIGLTTAVILLAVLGGPTLAGLALTMRRVLSSQTAGGEHIDASAALPAFTETLGQGLLLVVPFLVVTFLVAAAAQFVQVGVLFTTEPIRPKLSKLSPISGIKKIFGVKGIVKSGINIVKMSAVVAAVSILLAARLDRLGILPNMELIPAMLTIGQLMLELAILLCVMLLLIGAIDFLYQRYQHKKDLRMTKHEVKDERRNSEGDMGVKRRRFELYRKIITNQIQSATPEADVVIANPTHFAVCIKYDQETMRAPRVTAKGADLLAFQIRSLARASRVPIVERPPLARALFAAVEVGDEIAPEHYEAVAEVLAYVYRIDERARDAVPSSDRSTRPSQSTPQPAGAA